MRTARHYYYDRHADEPDFAALAFAVGFMFCATLVGVVAFGCWIARIL